MSQAATPLQAIEQKSRDLFYEPQFLKVVQQYLDLRGQDKREELEQFITERKELSLERINVRFCSPKSHLSVDIPCPVP